MYTDHNRSGNYHSDALERRKSRSGKHREGMEERRKKRSKRRFYKAKNTAKLLFMIAGISLIVSVFLVYVTKGIPNLFERIISRNIEKAINNATVRLSQENVEPGKIRDFANNVDMAHLRTEAFKRLGGWEGDRGENQAQLERKVYSTDSISTESFEELKEKHKDDYNKIVEQK